MKLYDQYAKWEGREGWTYRKDQLLQKNEIDDFVSIINENLKEYLIR